MDEFVYELYGITEEERKIMEGALWRRSMIAERWSSAARRYGSGLFR